MNQSTYTIILAAGGINPINLPVGTNRSSAMIPVNGRPVIAWILEDLIEKGVDQAVLVVNRNDLQVQCFVRKTYQLRISLEIALVDDGNTILGSFSAGLDAIGEFSADKPTASVRLILGDTLIRDSYDVDGNFVYAQEVVDSHRWCLFEADVDGRILNYFDKQEAPPPPYRALCGYYHFKDGEYLKFCLSQCLAEGEGQISDVLRCYGAKYSIYAVPVKEWYDFGHVDNLVDARRRLLQARCFNSLSIDPLLNTITKVSSNEEKLRDELAWYKDLPSSLKVLCPRVVRCDEVDGHLQLVQEYYGYPTLAELYLFSEFHCQTWYSIINHLLRVHDHFRCHQSQIEPSVVYRMYFAKTFERLDDLRGQADEWEDLLAQPEIIFNGRTLANVSGLKDILEAKIGKMAQNVSGCIIHGDYCFSNILFDVGNQIVRLIDPRGSFGHKGIWGDPRYDMAKLRHSISGLYDYIMADMFEISGDGKTFEGTIYKAELVDCVTEYFDQKLIAMGYDDGEVRLVESLLFLSMVPLHKDNKRRQLMMYLRGISLLNELLGGR